MLCYTTRQHSPLAAATAVAFSVLVLFAICFRKITRKRTVPADFSKPPHRFSFTTLRRATNNFSPSLRLGQGGFGSVYHGTLPNAFNVAVKVMDSGSLQGEREFQNELLFASKLDSSYIVAAFGFSYDRKHRSLLLVYDLMQNGNLQDALLQRKSWLKIDNSNQSNQNDQNPCEVKGGERDKINDGMELKRAELESNNGGEDYGSVVEETESVTTGFDEFHLGVDQSPVCMTSPETLEAVSASPEVGGVGFFLEGNLDGGSIEGGKELVNGEKGSGKGTESVSRKDWWRKQENGGATAENRGVKDYVMEWIGTEIKKERPNSDWIGASSSSNSQPVGKLDKKRNRKRLDWWVSLDDNNDEKVLKKEKKRLPREWWKEEYCEELEKKNKKKKNKRQMGMTRDGNNGGEDWWPRDVEMYGERKKKRSRSRGSRGSIEWFSGELFRGNQNSHDSLSGEIPKSSGISSTPSMRGTVCYVAPEYGGGGNLSEKSDVYSFGVLLLVLIAGRRPLQVTTSPRSKFHRANLMHWARNLARAGKLLELVDTSVQSLDRDQATLCITVALICLQKSPARRPSMKEVVGMLSGESQAPQLPTEFSPSPPTRVAFKSKSHKKVR
ncbi:hypothetical protein DKX38_023151 [Salix brachista]|uniref:Protein kinase domain-containing protein n=1 Tax=Salix brachista TaxID=2182728 RepID=A0A5N5K239_9ROSI|nr:hypothetical protein DKX38_023151 [Salix brachista]